MFTGHFITLLFFLIFRLQFILKSFLQDIWILTEFALIFSLVFTFRQVPRTNWILSFHNFLQFTTKSIKRAIKFMICFIYFLVMFFKIDTNSHIFNVDQKKHLQIFLRWMDIYPSIGFYSARRGLFNFHVINTQSEN